ncbi:MAG: DnaJ domain-containing protein [Deltaproteobacteria bacterium]|nr:DnaJ domain-containing protein [Deltaproteobacteria bacterium]
MASKDNQKNYYELLGLTKEATSQEIKTAYKEMARIFHPDSHFYDEVLEGQELARDDETFKLVTVAYNTLIDSEKRAEYDRMLLTTTVPSWVSAEETSGSWPYSSRPADNGSGVRAERDTSSSGKREERSRTQSMYSSEGNYSDYARRQAGRDYGGMQQDYSHSVFVTSGQRTESVMDMLRKKKRSQEKLVMIVLSGAIFLVLVITLLVLGIIL